MKKLNKLVKRSYWNEQYNIVNKQSVFTIDPEKNLAFAELDKYFKNKLNYSKGAKFIEIGCAPGGWMNYFHENFGYKVEGLEYTSNGVQITKKNLKKLGVPAVVHEMDLFNNTLKKNNYRVVFSAGFIEHFHNPMGAIKQHVDLLDEEGYLVLEIPNLRGFNYYYQKFVSNKILKLHNIEIMNIDFFKEVGKEFNLEEVSINYIGRINFGLFSGNKVLLRFGYIIQIVIDFMYKVLRIKTTKENKYVSPYIVAIFKK